MANLGDIIDYALKRCGDADAGNDRDSLLIDLIDLLTVDLPPEIGGDLVEGILEMNVGYTGSVAENGVYTLPGRMRSCAGVLAMVDDVSLATQSRVTPMLRENIFTMPDSFYQSGFAQYGDASSQNVYGQPQHCLIYANQLHLRPIPKQAGAPEWFGKVVLFGSIGLQDFSAADESTEIEDPRIVPAVRAGLTVLAAAGDRLFEVARLWSDIYTKRKDELRAQMSGRITNPQPPMSEF